MLGVTPLSQWNTYIRNMMLKPMKSLEPVSRFVQEVKKLAQAAEASSPTSSPEAPEVVLDLSKSVLLQNLHAANHSRVDALV